MHVPNSMPNLECTFLNPRRPLHAPPPFVLRPEILTALAQRGRGLPLRGKLLVLGRVDEHDEVARFERVVLRDRQL